MYDLITCFKHINRSHSYTTNDFSMDVLLAIVKIDSHNTTSLSTSGLLDLAGQVVFTPLRCFWQKIHLLQSNIGRLHSPLNLIMAIAVRWWRTSSWPRLSDDGERQAKSCIGDEKQVQRADLCSAIYTQHSNNKTFMAPSLPVLFKPTKPSDPASLFDWAPLTVDNDVSIVFFLCINRCCSYFLASIFTGISCSRSDNKGVGESCNGDNRMSGRDKSFSNIVSSSGSISRSENDIFSGSVTGLASFLAVCRTSDRPLFNCSSTRTWVPLCLPLTSRDQIMD